MLTFNFTFIFAPFALPSALFFLSKCDIIESLFLGVFSPAVSPISRREQSTIE